MTLTAEREHEIRERESRATKGPWTIEDPMGTPAVIADGHKQVYEWTFIAHVDTGKTKHSVKADRNAQFIAHARQDIPDLLAALTAAKAENERLRGALDLIARQLTMTAEMIIDPDRTKATGAVAAMLKRISDSQNRIAKTARNALGGDNG